MVEVQDRNNAYRVEKVELISPDGRSTLTSDITRERIAPGGRYNDGGLGVGVLRRKQQQQQFLWHDCSLACRQRVVGISPCTGA